MARKRRQEPSYLGDKILAIYQALGSCCGIGVLGLLSAGAFGFAAASSLRKELRATIHDPAAVWILDPQAGVAVGILAAALAIFFIVLIRGTWKSRMWALVVTLVLHALSVGYAVYSRAEWTSLVPAGIVALYCFLRVTSALGPRPS